MQPTRKSLFRRLAGGVGLQYIGLIVANVLIIAVMAARYEEFLSPFNIEVTLMSFLPEAIRSLGMTLVIQLLVYPENWPDHLLWGSILAYLVTRGAGAISLDHVIGRRLFGHNA